MSMSWRTAHSRISQIRLSWNPRGSSALPGRQECVGATQPACRTRGRGTQHRSVSIPDLIVAATAERYSLIVLHYDAGYDRIAELTGQRTEWVVPRGTADGGPGVN